MVRELDEDQPSQPKIFFQQLEELAWQVIFSFCQFSNCFLTILVTLFLTAFQSVSSLN